MQQHNFGTNYSKLEEYYEKRLMDIMDDLDTGYAVWQEIIDDKVTVSSARALTGLKKQDRN